MKKIDTNYEEKFRNGKYNFELTDEDKKLMENETYESPVYNVQRIPIEQIKANDYNPNKVSIVEFELLHQSMIESGWTLPVVVAHNEDKEDVEHPYVVVDGFHRVTILRVFKDLYIREKGMVPCVILNKSQSKEDRQIATIVHNRARGEHDVDQMSEIIADLVHSGLSDEEIRRRLGMDKEELKRMKQITGLASLFANKEFSESWKEYN